MKRDQGLFTMSEQIQNSMENFLLESKPDFIIVHGDTTTAAITAKFGFYTRVSAFNSS